jgi:ATP-dependent DNA helicase RecQ
MRDRALLLLRQAVGSPRAEFHPGQWEAIEALVQRSERLLVVQRTGWGKSIVYFLATKLLRERGAGCGVSSVGIRISVKASKASKSSGPKNCGL